MNRIKEADIKDKKGNIIVSAGLKVRHKKSQFEYTIDSVVQDKGGQIVVLLRKPEEPRFDSTPEKKKSTITDRVKSPAVIYEADPIEDFSTSYYSPESEEPPRDDDLVAVPQKEFEKDYEVK